MAKKDIKPDIKKVDMGCAKCGNEGHAYFSNLEIHSGTTIQQWCKPCNRTTIYNQK